MGTMPPPSDIVKVAIEWPGANAQLLEIDQVSSCDETVVQGEGAGKWHGRGRLQGQGPLASGVRASNRKAEACPTLWKVGPHGWDRLALRQKLSGKESMLRSRVGPAWQPLASELWHN